MSNASEGPILKGGVYKSGGGVFGKLGVWAGNAAGLVLEASILAAQLYAKAWVENQRYNTNHRPQQQNKIYHNQQNSYHQPSPVRRGSYSPRDIGPGEAPKFSKHSWPTPNLPPLTNLRFQTPKVPYADSPLNQTMTRYYGNLQNTPGFDAHRNPVNQVNEVGNSTALNTGIFSTASQIETYTTPQQSRYNQALENNYLQNAYNQMPAFGQPQPTNSLSNNREDTRIADAILAQVANQQALLSKNEEIAKLKQQRDIWQQEAFSSHPSVTPDYRSMANAQVDKYNTQLATVTSHSRVRKYHQPTLEALHYSTIKESENHRVISQIINNAPKITNGKIVIYGIELSPEEAYQAISLDLNHFRETGYHLSPEQLLAGIRYVTKPGRFKQIRKFDDEPNIPSKGTIQQRLSRTKTTGGAFRIFLRASIPMEKNLAKMYPKNSYYFRGNLANIAEAPAKGLITQRGQVPLTNAGRALMKHGNRPGSIFPSPRGNIQTMNQLGQEITEDILFDEATVIKKSLNRNLKKYPLYKEYIDIKSDYGQGPGIRYGIDFEEKIWFEGFLEP